MCTDYLFTNDNVKGEEEYREMKENFNWLQYPLGALKEKWPNLERVGLISFLV